MDKDKLGLNREKKTPKEKTSKYGHIVGRKATVPDEFGFYEVETPNGVFMLIRKNGKWKQHGNEHLPLPQELLDEANKIEPEKDDNI